MIIDTPNDVLTICDMKKLCDNFAETSNDTDVLRFWINNKMYAVTGMDFDGELFIRQVNYDIFGHAVESEHNED